MRFETEMGQLSGFYKVGFSDKVKRCIDHAKSGGLWLDRTSLEEALPLIEVAREKTTLAGDLVIANLMQRNADVLRLVKSSDGSCKGLFAYLPLNAKGVDALASGGFDGLNPKPEWLCRHGELPDAIYLWFVFMPGALARAMGVLAQAFDELVPNGCAVFSKAINPHAERLNRAIGFLDAQAFYPDCKPGLLVVFPQGQLNKPARKETEIRIARGWEDLAQVMSVRSATYIAEQFCHYAEEFDGNDFCATHLLGLIGGDAAGCIRIRFFADFAKIERLAVRAEYRRSRLSFELARAAIRHCEMKGYVRLYGHSRLDLVRFWRTFGFRERTDRKAFSFANVQYRELVLDLKPNERAITLDASPMVLIRPEGAWDRPGPLDQSPSALDPQRKAMIAARTRTLGGSSIITL